MRVRIYGLDADPERVTAMLEIKQRINRTVQKRRIALPLHRAYALAAGQGESVWKDPQDAAVAQEIEFLVRTMQLRPTCVISYLRTAWVGSEYEPGLRITFDQELTGRAPDRLLGEGTPHHYFSPPEYLVMEVKANDAVPVWVSRMLARHGCQLRRISKYCAGLAKLRASEGLPGAACFGLQENPHG